MKKRNPDFMDLLDAFNHGYRRIGLEDDWPSGRLRWAYVMGRRQSSRESAGL